MKKTLLIIFLLIGKNIFSQQVWHGIQRTVRHHPEGNDIVIKNGDKRFNRALYGGNTTFRAEAGDLPEFALYMPGMGGNIQLGVIAGNKSKWLIQSKYIKAIYRAGSMLYEIRDPFLDEGIIYLDAIALYDQEGFVIQLKTKNISAGVELVVVYGGANGKKFSRDGDIGADPESSFYLKSEYCADDIYQLNKNSFSLLYGFSKTLTEEERYEIQHLPVDQTKQDNKSVEAKKIAGIFPEKMNIKLGDANSLVSPLSVIESQNSKAPVIYGEQALNKSDELYFFIGKKEDNAFVSYADLNNFFEKAEQQRKQLAERVKVNTPDPYINTLGGVLSIAGDAIWEPPSYMHGAIAWRMRLNGWRGPYIADVFGWHDRAREHFSSYAKSQLAAPPVTGVVMDTALHLARHLEKIGTALFSDGYICRSPNDTTRANHYDMNLGFIDELLDHFNWTGDTNYVKQMWPLLKRHLAWEKRNFDADGDGLYDSYADIWVSDALQYSGGGTTHSSAYNYRANKMAAELAKLIGEDGSMYEKEANKILSAINKQLWMPDKGWYAEYKDLLGNKLVHPSAGLWTIYHAIDEGISDPFQTYQSLRYVDKNIPHIPIKVKGLKDSSLYTLASSNWQPYVWSLNNVVLAENLHTALAYWEGGRNDEAYKLWKGNLVESMYLESSPGNMDQLSFYDAMRGELYRDFADPIGMAGRSLVEGLFGIRPDALHDSLTIQPGFPREWNYASLETPDIYFDFKRNGNVDHYLIKQTFSKTLSLKFIVRARKDAIGKITVNGKPVKWEIISSIVNQPALQIKISASPQYDILIEYKGNSFSYLDYSVIVYSDLKIKSNGLKLLAVYDPEKSTTATHVRKNELMAETPLFSEGGEFFVQVEQGAFRWWIPVSFVKTNYPHLYLPPDPSNPETKKSLEKVPLEKYFNDKVTNIFKHQYLSPRPTSPTMQLPTQGIGNWTSPLVTANIDDSGTREKAKATGEITSLKGVPFRTVSDSLSNNIVFTSQWDNFPDSVQISLSGTASYLYLLMAGTTNPMQSQMINGMITVNYTDGTNDTLNLFNPNNWWPIEQDYYTDGFAFTTGNEMPERLYLKEGKFAKGLSVYSSIKGLTDMAIDGGAATVLEMHLNKDKTLRSLTLHTIANDVIIGLMAATLIR